MLKAICLLFNVVLLLYASEDLISVPVASFSYEANVIRIYASVKNGPQLPTSEWSFRYDPTVVPMLDEMGNVAISTTRTELGWHTILNVSTGGDDLKVQAYEEILDLYYNLKELSFDNIEPLPIRRITITFPGLLDGFENVQVLSPKAECQKSASCFDYPTQTDQLSVTFLNPQRETAVELANALRSSVLHYTIHSYFKGSESDVLVYEDDKLSVFLHGDVLLSSSKLNSSFGLNRNITGACRSYDESSSRTNYESYSQHCAKEFQTLSDLVLEVGGWTRYCPRSRGHSDRRDHSHNHYDSHDSRGDYDSHGSRRNYNCFYYSCFEEKVTWEVAQRRCRRFGADLPCTFSLGEENFISSLCGQDWWIGWNDQEVEGAFKCPYADGLGGYDNWATNEPNGGETEDCVVHRAQGWFDTPCIGQWPYACKRSLGGYGGRFGSFY